MPKQPNKIKKIKKDTISILEKVGLDRVVSIKEIEDELSHIERLNDSFLFLGIITRYTEEKKSGLLSGFIPLITNWKNFIPRKELGGLSPHEYEKRHPRGQIETWIINKLLQTYEIELHSRIMMYNPEDLGLDFDNFQKEFFDMIPATQPFPNVSITMNHRDIIATERKKSGHPSLMLDKFSAVLFAHEPSKQTIKLVRQIEDTYADSAEAISTISPKTKSGTKKLARILTDLSSIEPFMKCTRFAPEYYSTFAGAAIMLREYTLAEDLLRQSLNINPKFRPAQKMLGHVSAIREGSPRLVP